MKKLTIILLFLSGFLSGCRILPTKYVPPSRAAVAVDIRCQHPSGTIYRHYSDPGKIKAVLYYIRLLNPQGPIQIPQEAMDGPLYEITVYSQDGGVRIHRQQADSYAALHRQYWGRIDPSLGMRLGHLITLLPSDPLSANYTDIQKKTVTKS